MRSIADGVTCLVMACRKSFRLVTESMKWGQPQLHVQTLIRSLNTVHSTADVLRITGLSMTNLKLKRCQGPFPQPIKLSVQRNGDPARDVKEWIRQQPRTWQSANTLTQSWSV